jgi:putative ABC transport system permease protein
MDALRRDVGFALRTVRRAPFFSAIAILTLALGIGANTAVFSIVHPLLLQSLPYPEPDRLVLALSNSLTPANYRSWKAEATTLEQFSVYALASDISTGGPTPEFVQFMPVSEDFFTLAGVRVERGRLLVPSDHAAGSPPVAVLSQALWHARFGSDGRIGEETLVLGDRSYTVVGVLPPGFRYFRYDRVDAWLPLHHYAARGVTGAGRLAPGVTLAQADAQVKTLGARYEPAPELRDIRRFDRVVSMSEAVFGHLRGPLLSLFGAAGFVLLIACANVASLLIARASVRRRELAVRAALGADRGVLLRQLLTESALLALAGGAAGVVVAAWGTDALLRLVPGYIPRLEEVRVDSVVLAFALLIALGTALVTGLVPGLAASGSAMRQAASAIERSTAGRRVRHWREALVVLQVALALALLIGTTLFVRTYITLRPTQPGFALDDRITARINLPDERYGTPETTRAYLRSLVDRVASAGPGLDVAAVTDLPLTGESMIMGVRSVEGTPIERNDERPFNLHYRAATPNYMSLMQMPLVRGRHLDRRDVPGAEVVTVINETAAQRLFPDAADPVGRRFSLNVRDSVLEFTVVGVAADARILGSDLEARAEVWSSIWQVPWNRFRLVVQAAGARADERLLREAAAAVNPEIPLSGIATLRQIGDESVTEQRFHSTLMSVFGLIAVLLAVIGCYGVLAFSVSQRFREIGIRMALGARNGSILWLVLGRGLLLTLVGVTGGIVLSYGLTRVLTSYLYGVTPTDIPSFAAAALVLSLATMAAAYVPARRAARVDPAAMLRVD